MIRLTCKQFVLAALLSVVIAKPAAAVKIADLTHLQGQRENQLIGLGLVVGLEGTGDGGDFAPAIRPLAAFLQRMGNPVQNLSELEDSENVALVSITAVIGKNGARAGQTLDVKVSAVGAAESLEGGRLMLSPLLGPNPEDQTIYALAGGPVVTDPSTPTSGSVKDGATMEMDVINQFMQDDAFTLVIDDSHASWSMSSAVAMTINEAVSVRQTDRQLAEALDPKNVRVVIPAGDRTSPAGFIAWIQSLPLLMPEKQAKVTVNARTNTIVVDGRVTISPVTVTYRGMTISTEKLLKSKQRQTGELKEGEKFRMPESVDLKLLIESLEALKAPFEDRVAIIRELSRSGNLHGKLVELR